ncbi:hypothetical protein [uncultured Chitinophaga sp.]|uniref:hypothetical protein n=1 Tax=uncultured Chitinophaga sp. TaxID=339340 RepID=UPI00262C832C|nr:hypothetical protein [uncultured Chitinophaga sp.]
MIRKFYIQRSTWSLLGLSIAFFGVLLSMFQSEGQRTEHITALIAIATFYIALNKHWIEQDAVFRSLFDAFNERFSKLNDDLNLIRANSMSGVASDYKLSDSRTPNQVMQDYLNLCAEEYFWYKKGRIEKKIWDSWTEGIRYYLKTRIIYDYFKAQEVEDKAYYGFLKEIDLKSLEDKVI